MSWKNQKNEDKRPLDLVHPVYLNSSMMLDFLAHYDDGVSFSSDVSRKIDSGRKRVSGGSATAGVPSVASMLGLNLSATGKLDREQTEAESLESKFVRKHTAASLFNRLRTRLGDAEVVTQVGPTSDLKDLSVGDTIECEGTIDRNPLEAIADLYSDIRPYWHVQKRQELRKTWSDDDFDEDSDLSEAEQIRAAVDADMIDIEEMFDAVSNDLKKGNIVDLPMTTSGSVSLLLMASRDFYTPEAEAAMLGGQFKVLGKVSAIETNTEAKLTIVRRGVVGLIGEQRMEQLVNSMKSSDIDLRLPSISISGPWLQVIPLAIYV